MPLEALPCRKRLIGAGCYVSDSSFFAPKAHAADKIVEDAGSLGCSSFSVESGLNLLYRLNQDSSKAGGGG
jgi:hypothetical protein